MLMLVVFPAPFGPRNAHTSPAPTSNDTCVSAGTSSPASRRRYTFVTSLNSIAPVVIRRSRLLWLQVHPQFHRQPHFHGHIQSCASVTNPSSPIDHPHAMHH